MACKVLATQNAVVDLPLNGKAAAFTLDPTPASGAYFVELELRDSKDKLLSENLYWLAADPKDLQELGQLPKVKLNAKATRFKNERYTGVRLELENTSKTPALMTFLTLRNPKNNERILPAYIDENYVSLLPGQKKVVIIESPVEITGEELLVTLEGWNLVPANIAVP